MKKLTPLLKAKIRLYIKILTKMRRTLKRASVYYDSTQRETIRDIDRLRQSLSFWE